MRNIFCYIQVGLSLREATCIPLSLTNNGKVVRAWLRYVTDWQQVLVLEPVAVLPKIARVLNSSVLQVQLPCSALCKAAKPRVFLKKMSSHVHHLPHEDKINNCSCNVHMQLFNGQFVALPLRWWSVTSSEKALFFLSSTLSFLFPNSLSFPFLSFLLVLLDSRSNCRENIWNRPHIRRARVKVGLINLCKGLFSLNARIYYKLKSGT
jgi:hypothetical protein